MLDLPSVQELSSTLAGPVLRQWRFPCGPCLSVDFEIRNLSLLSLQNPHASEIFLDLRPLLHGIFQDVPKDGPSRLTHFLSKVSMSQSRSYMAANVEESTPSRAC